MTVFQEYVARYVERHPLFVAGSLVTREDVESSARFAEAVYWNKVDQDSDSIYNFLMKA